MKKKVAVLGATGSIGKSALDILRSQRDRFEPVLFASNQNSQELLKLKNEFPKALAALVSDSGVSHAGIDFTGRDGLLKSIYEAKADITINGIAGAAGLEPSIAIIESGSDLALANKETIVMASNIVRALAAKKNAALIPVDSEHSAIFRLLEGSGRENVTEIILTASGGPFRNFTLEQLGAVKPEEALAHPTWNMGPKITVDSASMANKGLEVIEAAGLFGFPPEKIKIVIHPQSVVHSMVRLKNNAVYAQMSKPDMRLPILDALSWPETSDSQYGFFDFKALTLSFESCDFERFPMLRLAYEALKAGPLVPALYNAANEIAVDAFLKGKIGFLEIPRVVGYVLDKSKTIEKESDGIEAVLAKDREGRELALQYIGNRS